MPRFISLLQLMFIGLKLTGFIAWPWWLVFSPFIILTVLYIIIGALASLKK